MSAIGTKQTWQFERRMSAFGGKADIAIKGQNACFLSPDWLEHLGDNIHHLC